MYEAIVFLPLLGAFIAGIFGPIIGPRASIYVTSGFMVLVAILSAIAFANVAIYEGPKTITILEWIHSGNFEADWKLRIDTLTAIMLVVVNGVSCLVHIYSIGYMHHDKARARFMSYLSLFTFTMLMLVTSDNLLQLFFGWEGVGVASYLLIGFWYHKPSAHKAAMKAFIVNRVGDFGFALGIFVIFYLFGSIEFDDIFSNASDFSNTSIVFLGFELPALEVAAILLFIGAMGKSAQLGLHTWLPDAMEGPTPVSALIHAATMVTAGVFLVCRLSPVIEYAPFALDVITVVGALTAIFAATIGMTQFDIKRVIAYSTCSQLGYMFFAAGVSAYPAAMFHLTTHAFFKALLFLGAGSVIHALSDEQDLRNMGGIWRKIPITYSLMWIGSLALAGFPFFAGYYSKDIILEAAWASQSFTGQMAFWLGCAAALLTAFYSWRLLIMAFHGKPRCSAEVFEHVHESPPIMILPLIPLAFGAIFAGWFGYQSFVGYDMSYFWGDSLFILPEHHAMEEAHHVAEWVKRLPVILAASGVGLAIIAYVIIPSLPARVVSMARPMHTLFFNKWFFDELYDLLFVRASIRFGTFLWVKGDKQTIDAFGPDGLSGLVLNGSNNLSKLQSGYVYHYAFAMMIGVVMFLSWYFSGFGR